MGLGSVYHRSNLYGDSMITIYFIVLCAAVAIALKFGYWAGHMDGVQEERQTWADAHSKVIQHNLSG